MVRLSVALVCLLTVVGSEGFVAPTPVRPLLQSSSRLCMNKKGNKNKSKKKSGKSASSSGGGFGGALNRLKLDKFNYAGDIQPGVQTPQKVVVDEAIMKPDYAMDGTVRFLCLDDGGLFVRFYLLTLNIVSNTRTHI